MLLLLRHGQSEANAAGLLAGRFDVELTEHGRREARAAGALLGPVAEVRSSPLRRAQETAQLAVPGQPLHLDDRFIELDYGEFDGRPISEVPHELWLRWQRDVDFAPSGGESHRELGRRVRAACEELFAEDGAGARRPEGAVVVVSHVSPIKAAVAWALGAGDEVAWRLQLANASVTAIEWGPRGPVLVAFNHRPILDAHWSGFGR